MADVLAVVRQATFQRNQRAHGAEVGKSVWPWDGYRSEHPLLRGYLEGGERLFLVTARPGGKLWMCAVGEGVSPVRKIRGESRTKFARPNRVPLTDVTTLRSKLRFSTGKGLTPDDAKLGNSLQSPRVLTDGDLRLLEHAIAARHPMLTLAPSPWEPPGRAEEGERLLHEVTRFKRDRDLALRRLREDGHRCRHCGFDPSRIEGGPHGRSHIVHVHHIDPLSDGKRETRLAELVTLCPTCHAIVHAIARAMGITSGLGLPLLAKHYPVASRVR